MLLRLVFLCCLVCTNVTGKSSEKSKTREGKGLTVHNIYEDETILSLPILFGGDKFSVPSSLLSSDSAITLFAGFNSFTSVLATIFGFFLLPLEIIEYIFGALAVTMVFAFASDVTGLSDTILNRNSIDDYNDIYSDDKAHQYQESLMDDEFVSNHLTHDYDFKDNEINDYDYHDIDFEKPIKASSSFVPSNLRRIASIMTDAVGSVGSTVWKTSFKMARSISKSPFGQDVSTLASNLYKRYLKSRYGNVPDPFK